MRHLLPILLLLVGLRTSPLADAGDVGLPKVGTLDGLGVNIHFTHAKPGELEMLAAGGFRFVRMDFFWAGIEKQKGVYDFSAFDHLMADLDRLGLRAYFILDYGHPLYDGGLSPHTDEGRAAFCAFVRAAMQRFAGRGIVWEMWNEPNHGMFWKPQPKVEDYAQLALAVGEAVREVAPQEILVGPTTSEIDLPFIEACFTAGCLSWWSAVSVHPYRQSSPETAAGEYRALRQLIARYARRTVEMKSDPKGLAPDTLVERGIRRIPIFSGEWGYSSAKLKHDGFDEETQGRYLPRQWLSNIANGIPISIWYDWHDDGDDRSNPEHNFGTVRRPYRQGQVEVYEPKPAYVAAKTLTTVLKGYEFSKALALKDDEHVLLFARGDQIRLAAWTSAASPRTVSIPASAGRFRITGHLGAERTELVADATGLTVTLTNEVQYLAPIDANPSLRLAVAWERLPLEHVARVPTADQTMALSQEAATGRGLIKPDPPFLMHRMTNPLHLSITANGLQIAAGQSDHLALIPFDASERTPVTRAKEVPLVVDGHTVWTQRILLVISNPVEIQLLPPVRTPAGVRLPVLIDNRRGTDFDGVFELRGDEALQAEKPAMRIVGGIERLVQLPIREIPEGRFTLGLVVKDPYVRDTIRSLPNRRYQMLPSEVVAWQVHPDGDGKVASTQQLQAGAGEVVPGLGDQPAIALDYRMEAGWKFLRVAPKAPIDLGNTREIGMWVHGDGSGNVVRLRLVDAGGQTFQIDGGRLAFSGWKWLTFALTPHTAHWGGANDGAPKGPLKLDTLFLLDQADQSKPSQGTVRIAGAMAVE